MSIQKSLSLVAELETAFAQRLQVEPEAELPSSFAELYANREAFMWVVQLLARYSPSRQTIDTALHMASNRAKRAVITR